MKKERKIYDKSEKDKFMSFGGFSNGMERIKGNRIKIAQNGCFIFMRFNSRYKKSKPSIESKKERNKNDLFFS